MRVYCSDDCARKMRARVKKGYVPPSGAILRGKRVSYNKLCQDQNRCPQCSGPVTHRSAVVGKLHLFIEEAE